MITEIDASQTHPLRRAVLRSGDPTANVSWDEDERETAFHLACVDDRGAVIAVASFSEQPLGDRPDAAAWRLRGMAVAPEHQGQRIGQAILAEAIGRLRSAGATVLWCNARDTAMSFYAQAGFVVVGDGFNTDETGLAHHVMVLDL